MDICEVHSKANKQLVAWSKVSVNDAKAYEYFLDYLVDGYLNDALLCNDVNCKDKNHINYINDAFEFIKFSIFEASDAYFVNIAQKGMYKIVPGWNENCKELYYKSKDLFLLWNVIGRPRSGVIFDDLRNARSSFRRALNFCKSNEVNLRKQKFLRSFQCKNRNNFWRDIRKLSPHSASQVIDGTTDLVEINQIFTNNYRAILDDPICHSNYPILSDGEDHNLNKIFFQKQNIDESIEKIKIGLGFDFIHAYHLKYAGKSFRNLLGRFLSACLAHSFLPNEMIRGVIRPVLKGNSCKMKSENYRPVMSSSVLLKLLEYCLMPIISKTLKIDPLQFGFQSGSSCDHAISIVKEVVANYNSCESNVYCAALDLSKAYDKTNHDIIIKKLVDSNIPSTIVKIFQFLFKNTDVCVRFNGVNGDSWRVKNGLRQGGCSSSLLFAFYIDTALEKIKSLNVGCTLKGMKINIVAFADDIFLMCPSRSGLQILINEISMIFDNLCLRFNAKNLNILCLDVDPI